MIRHLTASGAPGDASPRSRARLRRRRRAKASRRHCERFEMAVTNAPLQVARMVLRLPTPIPSSMGYFYSRDARAAVRDAAREPSASTSSSFTARRWRSTWRVCAAFRRSSTSATWTRRSGSSTRATSRSRCRAGYWLEGVKMEREERRLAGLFDLCTATTRAEWETLEGYGTALATDWFPNGVDSAYFAPVGDAVRPRHDLVRRAHGLLPQPGVHVRFLRERAAARARAPAADEARHRGRGPLAGGARARPTCRASPSRAPCPTCARTCTAPR